MRTASVLIVEDEALVGVDLQNNLENFGYRVTNIACTGKEAIQEIQSNKPEIVLMDINLKGDMSGIEIAKYVMQEHRIPVIYLTAYSDENTLTQAMDANPFGYLLKPYVPSEVHTSIQVALNRFDKEHYQPVIQEPNIEKLEYIRKSILRRKKLETKCDEQLRSIERMKSLSLDYYYIQAVNNTSKNFLKIEEYAESIGYTRDEILRMGSLSILLLVYPGDIEKISNFIENVIHSHGEITEIEFRLKDKSGNWHWFLNRSMIDFDKFGKKQIVSFVKEITKIKNLEQSYFISESKYKALNNNPYQGIAILDNQAKILEINSTLELLTGYKKEELNALSHTDYISSKGVKIICEGISKIKSGEIASFQIETRIFPKNSGSIWAYMVFSPVSNMEGSCKYIVCNFSDISESKLFERNDISTYVRNAK